jgi:perosamine synthetase
VSRPFRYVAPAGAPIGLADLARWGWTCASTADASRALRSAIGSRFGVQHTFLTSTGRAGLTVLLRALRRLGADGRDEVILPSYTCYSVLASVVKAGLRPRICDISPDTLDYLADDLDRVDVGRALAIVATNLYGIPNDLPALSAFARRHRIFLIDDAAQAMGASTAGRWSGTWGDAGLFSFDKGKNISAIDGGVIVTNSADVASALEQEMRALGPSGVRESGVGVLKALAYCVLLRPWLYGIPQRIPQLELGKTVFDKEFPLNRPPAALVALALTMLDRLDQFTATRRANAAAFLAALSAVHGWQAIRPPAEASAVYLRLPLLMRDAEQRDDALARLNNAGIGATGSYPASIAEVAAVSALGEAHLRHAEGGRQVARRILTLPTHSFVTAADIRRAVAALAGTPAPALARRLA